MVPSSMLICVLLYEGFLKTSRVASKKWTGLIEAIVRATIRQVRAYLEHVGKFRTKVSHSVVRSSTTRLACAWHVNILGFPLIQDFVAFTDFMYVLQLKRIFNRPANWDKPSSRSLDSNIMPHQLSQYGKYQHATKRTSLNDRAYAENLVSDCEGFKTSLRCRSRAIHKSCEVGKPRHVIKPLSLKRAT